MNQPFISLFSVDQTVAGISRQRFFWEWLLLMVIHLSTRGRVELPCST